MRGTRWLALLAVMLGGRMFAAEPPARSRDRPNVLLVVLDDIGFAQLGCYGGLIATPNIDRVAAGGLRYANFHVAPVCSPTRAALMSGRNPHRIGMATITEFANGQPNSRGGIRPDAGTLAEILHASGYGTLALGKWHLTPMEEIHPGGAAEHWPTGRGFEHFYGYMGGDTNQWSPELFRDRTRVVPPDTFSDGRPYHLDADLTEEAIRWLRTQQASAQQRPFFLYLAYCAGHAPHHAPTDYIERYRGKFSAGWDAAREQILERQKKLGLVAPDITLPPANPGVRPWSELSAEEQRVYARYHEVFAGCLEHTDHHFGRLLDHLERSGLAENTLVIVMSDNGASPEGGPFGLWNEVQLFSAERGGTLALSLAHEKELGGPLTFPSYPIGWTQAGNTPWRGTKGTLFEGGTRVPLLVRWPGRITDRNGIRHPYAFATDILPTVLEAAGITSPINLNRRTLSPLDGISLAYSWPADSARATGHRTTQIFEHHGHRALWQDGWKAIAPHRAGQPWENERWYLYHLASDPTEQRDLAATEPDRLRAMISAWQREASAAEVFPIDDRTGTRDVLRSPENLARTREVYLPSVSGVHKATALEYRQRSFTLTARISGSGDGVLAAQGGRFAGFSLYLRDGRPTFHYNWGGIERTTIVAPETLSPRNEDRVIRVVFNRRANESAHVTLWIDDRAVATGEIPHAITGNISHEPLDIGRDDYTPVSEEYRAPFAYTGTLREVVIETSPAKPN